MKIAFNIRKIEGPYGGANQFANVLERYLIELGHEVSRKLQPKLDLILIVSSQKHPKTTTFDVHDIQEYIALHPSTGVVHRVNSLDEQRGADLGINKAILEANRLADHTVYVSQFVKTLFENQGIDLSKPSSVILNGSDEGIFNSEGRLPWQPDEKMRIVTHHWSSNYLKGFDIYERLDQLLGIMPYKDLFEFYFIGNLPLGLKFYYSQSLPPAWGKDLGSLLRSMHIYLSAARNEASGQHHIEGMCCGLPVMYLNSGALPEYCQGFGVEFNLVNFEEKLNEIRSKYAQIYPAVLKCPYSGEKMALNYESLFQNAILEKRKHPFSEANIADKLRIHLIERPFRKFKKMKLLTQKIFKYMQES
jgi:glycosyltransferase involved in cell wall biosynthesis